MNELQIRISADTKQLKQAMSRTEQLLKNADNVLKQSSRSAFQLENSLAKLSKQFKAGAISEAEFNKQATILSKELDRQRSNVRAAEQEISRLNKSLGGLKTQPASTGARQLGGNMSNLTGQVRGANSVAIEFNRIIQDAPFGIIGVGNNLQQLAANFSNVTRSAGGTKAAIKASFSALLTPANLALLAISAVTTAMTLYALSSRGAKKEVDDLKEAQDAFNKSLKDTDSILARQFLNNLLEEVGLLKKEMVGGKLIPVEQFENAEQVVDALSGRINNLRKQELELLEKFLSGKLQDATRASANANSELEKSLALKDFDLYQELLEKVNNQLDFYKSDTNKATKATKDFTAGFDELIEKIRLGNQTAADAAEQVPNLAEALLKEMRKTEGIVDFKPVDFKVNFDPAQFDKLSEDQKKFYDDLIRSREQLEEFQKDMRRVGVQLSNVFAESFERGIFEGENFFDSIAQGFKRLLAQLASQLAAAAFLKILATIVGGPVGTAFSAGVAANPFGSLFGGARANGGPVSSNKAYLVGEKGPEIFQPSTSGRIIPNVPSSPMVAASGASAGVMQTIDVNVYGQIMNDKIVLSNARGKRSNGRFYGINN